MTDDPDISPEKIPDEDKGKLLMFQVAVPPEIYTQWRPGLPPATSLFSARGENITYILQAMKALSQDNGEKVVQTLLNISSEGQTFTGLLKAFKIQSHLVKVHRYFYTWRFHVEPTNSDDPNRGVQFSLTAPTIKAAMYCFLTIAGEKYVQHLASQHELMESLDTVGDIDNWKISNVKSY